MSEKVLGYDRRMSLWNNIQFGLVLPVICRIRGHQWTSWWGVLADDNVTIDHEVRFCLRCAGPSQERR